MMHWFSRLTNIRPSEGRRVLFLFIILMLAQLGAIWGATTAYAAFLKQVGLGALPWVMALSAVLSVLGIAVYTAFVDRVSNFGLLVGLYVTIAIFIAMSLGLIYTGYSSWAYPLLYLLFLGWGTVVEAHFATYISTLYDIQAAKRVLPVISAGARLGVIAAGLSMSLLTRFFAPQYIVAIWLVISVLVIVLLVAMPYIVKGDGTQEGAEIQEVAAEKQRVSFLYNIREGFGFTIQSSYLRWIAISTLTLAVLMALVEYMSSGILLNYFGTSDELATFLALMQSIGNLIVLPMLLFGLSRLIARLGLGNASLIFPVLNVFISGGLIFLPGVLMASFAFLDRTALRLVFQNPIHNLFFNAVPVKMRGRARAFVGGLVIPFGALVGGILLLIPLLKSNWVLGSLVGLLSLLLLATTYFIRQGYSQALVKMLEQEDYSFLLSQEISELPMADPDTLNRLQAKLHESTSHELTVFMTQLIAQIGGRQALSVLEPAIKNTADGRTRSAMLDVVAVAGWNDDKTKQFFTEMLSDEDGRVRQSAIASLERVAGLADQQFLERVIGMVDDPDMAVGTRALVVLVESGKFYQFDKAVQVLDLLLDDPEPRRRSDAVRVLGKIGDERAVERLLHYIDDPADQVRLEAALGLEAAYQKSHPALQEADVIAKMKPLIDDPVERVRQAALIVLGRLGTASQAREFILHALRDPSLQIRELASDVLVQLGKSVVPLIHPNLNSPNPQLRKMATVILCRINPAEFGPLVVSGSVTGNLLSIYRDFGYIKGLSDAQGYRSIALLEKSLKEQNHRLADEIFYLLTALHDKKSVNVIADALHNEAPRVRANGTEALESLTTPQMAGMIAAVLDPEISTEQRLSIARDTWGMENFAAADALRQVAVRHDEAISRALAVYALGEVGAKLKPGGETGEQDVVPKVEAPSRPRRRVLPADLLGALSGDEARGGDQGDAASLPTPVPDAKMPSDVSGAEPIPGPAFTRQEIEDLLQTALRDPADDVRDAAKVAIKKLMAAQDVDVVKEAGMLSTIDRIIFLKEVPFFEDMTMDQLRVMATVCEEEFYAQDERIYANGDAGGVLYVVVNGKVGIEQEKKTGSFARLSNVDAYSYFGEMNFFDNSPRSTSAVAVQDTLVLKLRREPLIALARQNPELSLELINVLSQRLRDASDRIADLTRSKPRSLHQFYDQFEDEK